MRSQATTRRRRRAVSLSIAVICLLVGLTHAGCSNSILGNATEAGLETILDKPAVTPTPGSGTSTQR
jgi:hypothetical protein